MTPEAGPSGPQGLLHMVEQLSAASTHDDVARVVASIGVESLGASAGFVAIQTEDGAALEMLSHVRVGATGTPLCRLDARDQLPVIEAWRFGVPILVSSARELFERYPEMDRSRADRAALASMPLEVDGVRIGALNLTFATEQAFGPEQQASLRVLAGLCAQALRRAQLASELERMRRAFTVTASHELRGPLTSIYGAAVALQEDLAPDPAAREQLVDMIVTHAERLRRVVDDLRLIAELDEPTEIACSIQRTELRATFDELLARGLRAPVDRERIQLALPIELPELAADPTRLLTALGRMLDNACRYSPADSAIRVEAAVDDTHVVVRIIDTGPGIPERDLERVFEKFHRADSMQRNGISGTGLGLYVARRLAEAMGGRTWLEPAATGTGIVACFELPRWHD
jgi:signal transduction histidine kinase